MSTDFSIKCEVLADVYAEAQWNKQLEGFKKYNDVGLPLAHFAHLELVEITENGRVYISETWEDLCSVLSIDPDEEYTSSEDVLGKVGFLDDDDED